VTGIAAAVAGVGNVDSQLEVKTAAPSK
jgi:hypothetical protein